MTKAGKILEATKKFDLFFGSLGNGLSVANKAKEVHGDYEKVAHISNDGTIKYYLKNLPQDVIDTIEKQAVSWKKNPKISHTQG